MSMVCSDRIDCIYKKKNENSEDNEFFIDKPTQFPDGFRLNVIISPH